MEVRHGIPGAIFFARKSVAKTFSSDQEPHLGRSMGPRLGFYVRQRPGYSDYINGKDFIETAEMDQCGLHRRSHHHCHWLSCPYKRCIML